MTSILRTPTRGGLPARRVRKRPCLSARSPSNASGGCSGQAGPSRRSHLLSREVRDDRKFPRDKRIRGIGVRPFQERAFLFVAESDSSPVLSPSLAGGFPAGLPHIFFLGAGLEHPLRVWRLPPFPWPVWTWPAQLQHAGVKPARRERGDRDEWVSREPRARSRRPAPSSSRGHPASFCPTPDTNRRPPHAGGRRPFRSFALWASGRGCRPHRK